ncbi:hypothetical protein E1I69_23580 [Bacillus timonensis]|uniref:Holin n=2 Tax=Bacillus timonensis TaxID=1033734 RepID=A0A4S3PID0_9BACI|nr:hypothetical protein E1I69_23580 [Bacillus timonensis]
MNTKTLGYEPSVFCLKTFFRKLNFIMNNPTFFEYFILKKFRNLVGEKMDLNLKLYIRQDAFILIPVLYFIGLILKETPFIPQWTHRWIQLSFAIFACLLYYGFLIQSVVQAILVTGTTMISEDLIKNTLHGINSAINKKDE